MIKKIIYSVVGIFFILSVVMFQHTTKEKANPPYTTQVIIQNKKVFAETVKTREAMARGLSGRTSMHENQGMLFDYGKRSNVTPGFWMPDMKFNLDILWIKDNKIIGVAQNIPAPKNKDEKLPLYYPPSPVDSVLELNSGWIEKNNIHFGDTVTVIN